ncbi:type 1 glutamine amidotransferase [Thermoactinospora rubra]|uniref:type 1 glutamine amidotransferase n=1 Tax=Thermoactinospora rubra TaxID=1088767 RepID=UPI000A11AE08|nr:type 1 glutamine amidotransferase [Thermoactinospora rubra]
MRITVIEHEAEAGLGYFADWLDVPCDVVRPYLGDSVPSRAADGLIVLGGEASAWDDDGYPWLPATRSLLRACVADGTPTLGICLGAQLMTLACGGAVERGAAGLEAGACAVTALPAASADPLLSGLGTAVAVQYHQDAMTRLPEGAVLLMTGAAYPHQAYRLGSRAWAVQFHPEATPDIFASWTAATGREELNAGVKEAADELVATWEPVARRFAAVVAGRLG